MISSLPLPRCVAARLRRAASVLLAAAVLAPAALAQSYTFSTFAGAAQTTGSTDATGTAARFNLPSGITVDSAGNLYVADRINRIIRKITPAGVVTTLAGTAGVSGHLDGTGSAAQFMLPTSLAVDGAGNVYVADQGAHLIRKITPAGVVTTLAGTAGTAGSVDGTGTAASFRTPSAIAVNSAGTSIYVGDSLNHAIRHITAAGVVTLFAGAFQTPGSVDATGTAARLNYPAGLALDGAGNLYVSDGSNNQIRAITPAGVVTTLAGTAGTSGSTDGTGATARFSFPAGIAFDNTSGALVVADESNSTIRRVTLTGVVTTVGGSAGVTGSTDGASADARFRFANGIAVDASGRMFVTDEGNSTIRLGVPDAPRLISMSQRANSTGGDGALLASFTIEGSASKKVLLRALGPALSGSPFNVSGAMADPFLAVYDSAGTPLFSNNDWAGNTMQTDAFTAVGANPLTVGSKDSVLLASLAPGNYTARITGVGGTTGVALLELYDMHEGQRIAYASNRSSVATGGTNITSFAIGGPGTAGTRQVLIRAVGAGLGITGALADPTITLKTVTGTTIASNDNWGTHEHQTQLATATSAAGAMPLATTDSALLVTLAVGIYNVETTGVGGTGGVVLTEIHTLGPDRPTAIAPALLVPLHDQTLAAGSNITLSAPFVARPAPTFQWQRNSADLSGQTNATLAITNLSASNAGAYRVILANTAATVTSAVTQFKLSQTITFPEVASRQFNFGTTFTLEATASSGLPITYTSSNPDIASVSGSTVTINDVGTVTLTALQIGDSTYGSAPSVTRDFTVTKRAITVTLGSLTHTFNGSPKSATATLDPDVPATVNFTYNGNASPPSAVGSYTVVATISSIHYEGTATGTLVIGKAPQTITFDPIDNKVFGTVSSFTVSPTSSASLPVTLASSNTDVVTVSGNTLSIVGGGTVTITATQAGDATFQAAAPVARAFTVFKAPAIVTLGSLSHTYNGSVKGATATTNPTGLTLSFTYIGTASSTTAPTNVGSYEVTATVVSNNYAGSATGTLVISKAPQTISFATLDSRAIDQGSFTLGAPIVSVDSGLPLTFTSGTPAVASISGNTVTLHTTGATLITASQPGNENYLAATSVERNLVVLAASQTITFTQSLAKTFGNAPFELTATASSTLPVSYTSSNSAVATVSGSTVTIVGAGDTTITASQAGNTNFAAAPNIARTLSVAKAAATITLGSLSATYNGSPRAATATTAPVAGLSVIFNYTPGGATAPTNVGSYQVAAAIDDANYAGTASGTLVIEKAPQTITFATLAPRLINVAPFTLGATADSGLTVAYTSSNSAVATISGNTVTLVGLGTSTITAKQAGDANYLAAPDVARTLTVNPVAPVIVAAPPATASALRGRPFLYGPITLNPLSAPVTFSATGLPAGLNINAANGNISGTPTAEGTADITITATNATGTASHAFTLTVQPPPPTITSPAAATGVAGSAFSYTIVAAGATSFSATGLPEWLTLNPTTGILSGTPPAPATLTVQITATNATGSATQPLVLGITAPTNAPAYAGTLTPSGTVGVAFTFTPNFGAGTGTTFALTGTLPTGITFNSTTGALSGTPTQTGAFPLSLSATRVGVTATAALTLTINPAATAPVVTITGGNVRSGAVGSAFGPVAITATPAATSFTIGTLPAGLVVGGTAVAPTISGTPTSPGTTSIPISATAGSLTGPIATLIISIAPHASAPVATSSPVVHGRVGEALTYTLTATPAATSWGMSGALPLPPGLTFDGAAGTVTGTPTGAMTRRLFFAGTNASGIGIALEVAFIIAPRTTVPVVNSNGTASGQVGQPFSYTITATNSPTSFSTTTLPAGLTLSGSTGVISGIPTTATPPDVPALVMLGASNADGTSLPKPLRITIAPAAATPLITSPATASGRVGATFTYQITASETPTSFVASNLPAGLSVNPTTGVISGTPTVSGHLAASIAAANAAGLGAAAPLTLFIGPALTAPAITSAATASGQVGVAFTYQIVAAPGPITSYALTGTLPPGLTLNTSTGAISGSPTQPGFSTVGLTATSDGGTSLPQPLAFRIHPAAGVPVITSAGIAVATVGASFSYTIEATNSPTSRDAVNLPDGLAVNPFTGVISGVPTAIGATTATLVASNAAGTGPARDLVIRVQPAGAAPVVIGAVQVSAQVGVSFTHQITATNSPTAFEVHGAPPWMTVNNTTGVIAGTPTSPGLFPIILLASNSAGSSAPQLLTLTVAAASGTPVVTSSRTASGTVGAAFATYTITASPAATSYLAFGLPPGLALNAGTGAISGTPTASGTYPVSVSAANATGHGTPVTVVFTIAPSITFGL